ncbi:DUF3592 domain-containing protein [Sedimenticola selenatireducens]|uniref:DUF3592 domain-containing protein n=1 Tax=Sedimenticola selenatireducens TaxID=191960 RepID=A0A558DM26_9GAMM|nr:DUF3592 domain-containing protein [Sedimenticola selenatireducens]TVO78705.1 DUF3592 domain-containing protein [Sedimenticola selenatireducens]TVT62067.1 MAG: DUF3592 domain-containing protein [Sedimenticola selenatireducens]
MSEQRSATQIPFSIRMRKALPWFVAASLAFYFIGFGGSGYLDTVRSWPLDSAQVKSASIQLNPHMADEYTLSIRLHVQPQGRAPFEASLYQVGPKGALERRVRERYSPGALIRVRSNPDEPGQVVLDPGFTSGPFVVAFIVALLVGGSGFKILNGRSDESRNQ